MDKRRTRTVTRAPVTGPHPGARPGVGARRRAPGGWRVFAHGTRPGSARNGQMATWVRLPVGSPPAGRSMRGRCNVVWVASDQNSGNIGTWNVTSLGGNESLSLCGSSLRGAGPSTTLELPRVSGARAGVGLLIAPQLSRHVLEFTPSERVGRFPAPSGRG
ncbi:hypothetical protein L3Q82_014780 [Scortum barcoo]|uniref:Uncharacterized protein n=1 Tax=Scortum barcoo TaxID=214431 RepID=A0ACB8VRU4_9TELE|nr:hypothetical protein L3Q82_014780 [Scortum barcoo]